MEDREPVAAAAGADWHTRTSEEVAGRLSTGPRGLGADEAAARLERHGPNVLPETPPTSAFVVLLHQFTSPLIYILVVAAVITVLLGDYIDAGVIAAVLVLNAMIGYTQERRAENSVRALMRLMAPRAHVIRGGRERDIESRELVPGDVVLLESGARVPADVRLFAATALRIDESLLTGESLPVTKETAPLDAPDAQVADRTNLAYMATVVSSGRGRGYVIATGTHTAVGAIAESIRTEADLDTPLQQRMTRFAHVVGIVVLGASLLAFVIGLLLGQPASQMFTVAVALAVAAVPEGLPVVFTITLALGVRRMARRQAIIRRLPAVETLGSTTVIGSDKTGTLTENRMTVREAWAGRGSVSFDDDAAVPGANARNPSGPAPGIPASPLELTLLAGVLTNEAKLYVKDGAYDTQGDPTEAALLVSARRKGFDPKTVRDEYPMVTDLPFEPERQYSASLRRRGDDYFLFVKGAPERLLALSTKRLSEDGEHPLDPDAVHAAARAMASRGLRVLAMAYRRLPEPPRDATVPEPAELTFLGLQGMMDPPRAAVPDAIRGCQNAGIRVVMITGDHAQTALAIGRQLGIIAEGGSALTGAEIEEMDAAEFVKRVETTSIFARVAPEHKLRVVRALQSRGEIVAVTGDGVNDGPALKAADIGIAMGQSGTDVAREAADMVLADDNFVSIKAAVEEGRVTFDNIRKVTFFLVSTGAAAIVMILTALTVGWPLPMVAAQLLWLNLVTSGLQDVALAFEPGEPDVLERLPRPREEGVMSALLWERTVLAGLVMAAGTLYMFRLELDGGASLQRAQTVALTTMVLFQMFHVGNCRSEYLSIFRKSPLTNPFLLVATAAALVVHVGALHFGPTQLVLRVEPIELATWGRIVIVASSILLAIEAHKRLRPARNPASLIADPRIPNPLHR